MCFDDEHEEKGDDVEYEEEGDDVEYEEEGDDDEYDFVSPSELLYKWKRDCAHAKLLHQLLSFNWTEENINHIVQ